MSWPLNLWVWDHFDVVDHLHSQVTFAFSYTDKARSNSLLFLLIARVLAIRRDVVDVPFTMIVALYSPRGEPLSSHANRC